MKSMLRVSIVALGLLAATGNVNAAGVSVHFGEDRGDRVYVEGRERNARLVKESEKRIIEPNGQRVLVTKRVFERPNGDRFERTTRRLID